MFSNIPWYSMLFLNSCSMWLKQTFDEADKNGDGSLSISEVLQLMHKLNVNLPRQKVKQMFKVRNENAFCFLKEQGASCWRINMKPNRRDGKYFGSWFVSTLLRDTTQSIW